MKKYEILKDQSLEYEGRTLYRIKACVDFICSERLHSRKIKAGDLGGYIEKESNLSHDINDDNDGSWVGDNAKVMDNVVVSDLGVVLNNSVAKDNVVVRGYGGLNGDCIAYGNAIIEGKLMGKVIVGGNSEIADGCDIDGDIEFTDVLKTYERCPFSIDIKGNAVIKGSITIDGSWER